MQPKTALEDKPGVSYWVCSAPKGLKLLDWDKYWAASQSAERATEKTLISSSFPSIDPQLASSVLFGLFPAQVSQLFSRRLPVLDMLPASTPSVYSRIVEPS
jgi:hypothetical protein